MTDLTDTNAPDLLIATAGHNVCPGFVLTLPNWGDDDDSPPSDADTLHRHAGNDTLAGGGDGDDVLRGMAGRDRLDGWAGSNHLFGGKGRDRLILPGADDRATGGRGADAFQFSADPSLGGLCPDQ